MWIVFANLKHNTSPAIDGDSFAPAHQGLSSLTHNMATPSGSPTPSPHRNTRRTGRQDVAHGVLNVSRTHFLRDPFSVDYGLWPFDDRDYDIVCTVTNNVINTDLFYGRPFFPKTHVVNLAYSIKVAAVIAALPNIASAGDQPPLKISYRPSTPNSKRTILMDLYLRRRKYACAPPPAVAKVIIDVTAQVMVVHVTPIIGDTTPRRPPRNFTLPRHCRCAQYSTTTEHFAFYPPNAHHSHETTGQARQVCRMRITTSILHHADSTVALYDGAETAQTHP